MADPVHSSLPAPTAEQRKVAAGQYERANQVIKTGNLDYGIQLLLTCCKLDPANLIYRQALRHSQKLKHQNNLRGSRFSFLSTSAIRTRLKAARAARDHARVLECGEEILVHNPWDTATQLDMAESADACGALDLAVWILEQSRQKDPQDPVINRALARLYEKRGNFAQAINLWAQVRKSDPADVEASHKAKDLAASATIAMGKYQDAVDGKTAAPLSASSGESSGRSQADPALAHAPASAAAQSESKLTVGEMRIERESSVLKQRIAADPTNPACYLQLAHLYRRCGQIDKARLTLTEALGPTGNDFEVTLELADVETEPFRRNLEIAEQRLVSRPTDPELLQIRGRIKKEIISREIEYFRQKVDRFPQELSNHLELGIRLLQANQIDAAIVEIQLARNDPRCRSKALLHLGYCFKARSNWRLAQRNFEEALQQVQPAEEETKKEILFQLATGIAETGDLARAVELGYDLANLDFAYNNIGRLLDSWQAKLEKV